MDNPAATLEIPCEEDVPFVLAMIQSAYDDVETEYERTEDLSTKPEIARQGSLCQELFAQLSNQGYSRFD